MNLESAERAIRHGSTAGFVSAGLTLAMIVIALASDAGGALSTWADPWNLVDVVFIAALAFGIRRRSRIAATSVLAYFILGKILLSMEQGQISGIGVGLVFVYYFAKSVQGTFAYHRIRREQRPSYKPSRKWAYFVWPPAAILVLGLIVLGVLSELGITPHTAVQFGADVHRGDLDLLRSEGILAPDEEIDLFYSAGMFSILEDGNLLTNRRAISYWTEDDQLLVASVEFDRIADVSIESSDSFLEDSRIFVTTVDGDTIVLLASPEERGDKRFFAKLRVRWKLAIN